ncbi:hypothetical protein RND81_13G133700 [Saponaria officinalis]|uniref:Serpin domain-containing protein n=1 Tax=Saponaria officinalis TaxID=3572 RepID=A0AAW1H5E8_SAPOF
MAPYKKNKRSTNLRAALSEANKSVSCNKNFVCSPLGIEIMLSILANGSSGETRSQIYKLLGSKTLKDINQKASQVMEIVSSPSIQGNSAAPVLSFVNGAWADLQNTSLKPAFQKLLHGTYKADAKAVDFRKKEEVCKEINLWVSEVTRGVIEEMLSPELIEQDTILVLGNALFFKAAWEDRFVQCNDMRFHLLDGKTVVAPFMTTRYHHKFNGACFDDFRLLRIPYKTGEDTARKFAMYIFLPNIDDGLVGLMQRFSKDSGFLHQNFELPKAYLTNFWIPKFKFSDTFSVKDTLQQLGLDRMFTSVGELNKIVNKPFSDQLYVSKMFQKSFVEVNEEGTLAASGMVALCGGGGPPPNQFEFVADHPFMFMIREEISQVTLFVGTVLNPLIQ